MTTQPKPKGVTRRIPEAQFQVDDPVILRDREGSTVRFKVQKQKGHVLVLRQVAMPLAPRHETEA